jgi:hypothetical protein
MHEFYYYFLLRLDTISHMMQIVEWLESKVYHIVFQMDNQRNYGSLKTSKLDKLLRILSIQNNVINQLIQFIQWIVFHVWFISKIFIIYIWILFAEDATYIDSTLYGYGDKQIVADTWLVKLDGAITYSTVSRGDCIPLTGDVFTEDPSKFLIDSEKKLKRFF